jgi:hypothetical protein
MMWDLWQRGLIPHWPKILIPQRVRSEQLV